MKIVIAPDSFKGSLTAQETAAAMAEGILQVNPKIEIHKIFICTIQTIFIFVFKYQAEKSKYERI